MTWSVSFFETVISGLLACVFLALVFVREFVFFLITQLNWWLYQWYVYELDGFCIMFSMPCRGVLTHSYPCSRAVDKLLQEVSQGISNLPVTHTALQYVYSTERSKSHLLIYRSCIDKMMSSYHGRGNNCRVLTDGRRKEPVWCYVGSTSIECSC